MIPVIFETLGVVTAAVTITGVLGAVALRLTRRYSMRCQMMIVVMTVVVGMSASFAFAAAQMRIDEDDLPLILGSTMLAGAGTMLLAWRLGNRLVEESRRIRLHTRQLASGRPLDDQTVVSNWEYRQIDRELHAAERTLRDAREMNVRQEDARKHLITGISHDLRTPLAAMDALVRAYEDGIVDDRDEFTARLRAQSGRLGALVDDFFAFSLIEIDRVPVNPEDLDLADLVGDAVATARTLGATVHLEIDEPNGAPAFADPLSVERILMNLLANAVQHTPDGTPVTVILDRDAEAVRVSVEDRGPGMSPDALDQAFAAGWRGDVSRTRRTAPLTTSGAGLGLSIARGLAVANGGTLHGWSPLGAGCRFTLTLPLQQRRAAESGYTRLDERR